MALPVDFTITQNDQMPSLIITVKDGSKQLIDWTAAVSLQFHMTLADGTGPVIQGSGSFPTPRTSGQLQYDWASGDTAIVGRYNGEFEVIWPGSKTQTVPSSKIKMQIDVVTEIA